MTWKAYAAVSGAGVLATYMGLGRPAIAPEQTRNVAAPAATAARPALDIQTEALRLEQRLQAPDPAYLEPARDPFHFQTRRVTASAARVAAQPVAPPPVLRPEPPPMRLAGIATTGTEDARQRVAIVVMPQGRLEVREGDPIGADYRVTRIDEDAVELTAPDGTVRRLRLRP